MGNTEVVRAAFEAYRSQDLESEERLLADDFVFTSPYRTTTNRSAFLERCFPTADRFFVSQEIVELVDEGPDAVFILYEYELHDGARYRNVEHTTVRDGSLLETQVFFGGRWKNAQATSDAESV